MYPDCTSWTTDDWVPEGEYRLRLSLADLDYQESHAADEIKLLETLTAEQDNLRLTKRRVRHLRRQCLTESYLFKFVVVLYCLTISFCLVELAFR